jgi:peptide/nickel transport system substrate-binding protein
VINRRTVVATIHRSVLAGFLAVLMVVAAPGATASEGQLTWAVHFAITPSWFDPGEHQGFITAMLVFYALHDALVKPMPGTPMAPSLAESWSASRDGLAYEFVLRRDVKFHNGDTMTAEDVKFSFERYRGAAATLLREKVARVEIVNPYRVRFRLKEPWPDFLTFYATPATGAAWIVPKKYVEQVGDEGFKRAPVGAGPYRLVSSNPGVETVLEAHEGYWRKAPSVRRLVFRVITDDTTRLAMLKRGEVDIAYSLRGPLGQEVRRTPGLTLGSTLTAATFWIDFTTEQWDPKSPWHDRRVRLAASLALDRQAVSRAETLGFSRAASSIIPAGYEFAWAAPPIPYDPERAKKLLAEAGYPDGFDAGDYTCDRSRRGGGQRPQRRRDQNATPAARASGLHGPVAGQDGAATPAGRQWRLRQRRDPHRARHDLPRRLRLRFVSRDRRALRPADARDRSHEARGIAPPDPEDRI